MCTSTSRLRPEPGLICRVDTTATTIVENKRVKEGEPSPISKRGGALIEYFAGPPSLHLTHLSCSSVRPPPSRCCGRSGAAPATSPRGRAASRRARGGSTTAESGNQRRRRHRLLLRGGAANPGPNQMEETGQRGTKSIDSVKTEKKSEVLSRPGASRASPQRQAFPEGRCCRCYFL